MKSIFPTFSIGYSRSRKLKRINSRNTCDESIDTMIMFIKDIIEKLKKVKDFDKTSDYKKYNLYPGQQIIRDNILKHSAIYIYDGIIAETGSAPQKCYKAPRVFYEISESITGLSTIKNFLLYAKRKEKCGTLKITTDLDNNKKEILERMKRLLKVAGKHNFNMITKNCKHISNYVTYNKWISTIMHNVVKYS